VLRHPGRLRDKGHMRRLRNQWNEIHEGLDKAHRIAILGEGMESEQIGIPPEDAQFLQTRAFQRQEMAAIFQVPLHKIGDLERATFCLPASAEVYTAEGPKPIVDIRPGDLVWSRQDGGGLVR